MKIESKDIYKIQIDDVITGEFHGDDKGFTNFETNVDEVIQDDLITIKISGNYACFNRYGYTDNSNTFKGTLIMNKNEFISEYTNAKADGKSYITFGGDITVKPTAEQYVKVKCNFGDTYKEIIKNLRDAIEDEIEDGSDIINKFIKFVIKESTDKIIEEIKRIDNKDLDKGNEYVDYVLNNIIDSDGELKDDKYKSIDAILLAKTSEKSDELDELINDGIEEVLDGCVEEPGIIAKVYFSGL